MILGVWLSFAESRVLDTGLAKNQVWHGFGQESGFDTGFDTGLLHF